MPRLQTTIGSLLALVLAACSSGPASPDGPPAGDGRLDRPGETAGHDGRQDQARRDGDAGTAACPTTPPPPSGSGKILHVSSQGSDTSGDGTAGKPFASVEKAAGVAQPGETIELAAGTYGRQVVSGLIGAATAPIIIRAAAGAKVLIDGSAQTTDENQGAFEAQGSQHLVVSGLEVTNAKGRGFSIEKSKNVTLQRSLAHDTLSGGIIVSGQEIVVDGNEVHHAVLKNKNGALLPQGGGWASSLSTNWYQITSSQIAFRRNVVHDSWGECMIALFVDGGEISDNVLQDCWSVHLYLDHARGLRVERNQMIRTAGTYDRPDTGAAAGLLIGYEEYPAADMGPFPYPDENVVVANNLFIGVGAAIGSWCDTRNKLATNTFRSFTFAHNVIDRPLQSAIDDLPWCAGLPAPTALSFVDNVVLAGKGVTLAQATAWTFSHNCWQNTPGAVSGPGDVAAPCQVQSGTLPVTPTSYAPLPGSPLLGAGLPVSGVTTDRLCRARSGSKPTIGANESP